MKRIAMLLFSILILCFAISDKDTKEVGKELGVEVLSQEEIDFLCLEKEFAGFETGIQFDGRELGYDAVQNMLLIPHESIIKMFERYGGLTTESGRILDRQF